MITHEDRRKKRSDDPLIALHYQLAEARREGSVEAIVLADGSGVVVAGAGAWAVCEELAAYAPLLAGDPMDETRPLASSSSPCAVPSSGGRLAELHAEIDVRPMQVEGVEVYLATRGGDRTTPARSSLMKKLAGGIERILQVSRTFDVSTRRAECATPA